MRLPIKALASVANRVFDMGRLERIGRSPLVVFSLTNRA